MTLSFLLSHALQTGCSDEAKDEFWTLLDEETAEVPSKGVFVVTGDINGYVGATKDGSSCRDGFGYGLRNVSTVDVSLSMRSRINSPL